MSTKQGLVGAAEKAKVAAMEKTLEGEQNRVTDLSNKLSFYGDAYKRLQGKLATAESAVNTIKKELANQKKKYTELSTKLALTEKELQGVAQLVSFLMYQAKSS